MVQTPLPVRVPGQEPGLRLKIYTQLCDVAPAVLDWLGLLNREDQEERKGFVLKNELTTEDMLQRVHDRRPVLEAVWIIGS